MGMTCVILITMVISLVSAATVKLPSFVTPGGGSWPERVKYVRPGNYKELFCTAEGNPKPIYKWFRDGHEIGNLGKDSALSINETTGLLNVTKHYSELSDGLYQCMAYNSGGAAMTSPIQLSLAKMNTFPGSETIVNQNKAYETDYFSLKCANEPLSVPRLTFNWVRRRPPPNPNAEVKNTDFPKSDRVIVDPEGTLHFLWLEQQDSGYEYLCTANNDILLTKTSNTDVQMVVVENRVQTDRDPRSIYSKNVEVIAGEDATLTCIFTYYVANKNTKFEVKWYFGGSTIIGTGNDLVLEKVKIPTADKNQEGEYRCEAWLGGVKKLDATVNLKIKAPPQFLEGQKLTKLDVPVGGTAVFHCGAESYKSRTTLPTWMLNGEILYGCSQPYNFDCNERTGGGTHCLPRTDLCNGIPSCPGGIDEKNCEVACAEGMVPCNGTCVSSPAKYCVVFCEYPKFLCDDNSKCLEKSQVCDGRYDCKDDSDEVLCETGKDIVLYDGKFILNANRSTLTVPNVSQNDNMCFQCIVTNGYGLTLFGGGCLTAIAGIKVTNGPDDVYSVKHGSFLTIYVDAITDERYLKQLRFEWIMYVDAEDGLGKNGALNLTLPPLNTALRQFFSLSQTGKNLTIIIPKLRKEDEQSYDDFNSMINRKYAAVISHPYDKVVLNFTIEGKEVPKPVPVVVVKKGSSNLWIIALVLAIIVLFVVVILIVCYMYRNRGGTYPLDRKEHQAGHDPEQELKDSGFHDVGRVEEDDDDEKPRADEVSLSESVKPYESDEDITEEYGGDFDISKFNEDGSFIGLYGDKKSKHSNKEATV